MTSEVIPYIFKAMYLKRMEHRRIRAHFPYLMTWPGSFTSFVTPFSNFNVAQPARCQNVAGIYGATGAWQFRLISLPERETTQILQVKIFPPCLPALPSSTPLSDLVKLNTLYCRC